MKAIISNKRTTITIDVERISIELNIQKIQIKVDNRIQIYDKLFYNGFDVYNGESFLTIRGVNVICIE